MDAAPAQIIRFESFALDSAAAELRKSGETVAVEPQVLGLLTLLLHHHDRVVTRDEIIATVWNGRIVSDSAISSRINALRRALDDDGTEQRLIRTVHGRGFRFGVVPEFAARAADTPGSALAIAAKPSIAVLPFVPMSDQSELEYFCDGIAEDIIDALSRFHEFAVIARNSSFAFRGQTAQTRDLAEALRAKYLLSGSVRQVGQRIRVSVQLVDAASDRTIWSDRYDGDLSDIFKVQDEITAKAVAAIAPQAHYAEISAAARKETTSLTDWERVMRARWHMGKYSREDTNVALDILQQVVETTPDLAIAHGSIALCHYHKMLNTWGDDPGDEIRIAGEAARRAVAFDAYDAGALAVLGLSKVFQGKYDESRDLLEDAVAKNPNLANGYGFMSDLYGVQGDLALALEYYDRAIFLSPADPTRTLWMSGKGIALILNRQYEAAAENAERMLRIEPGYGPALRQKACALSYMGRADEARQAMAQVLRYMPSLTATRLARMIPVAGPENRQHWLDGLRKAGLPD